MANFLRTSEGYINLEHVRFIDSFESEDWSSSTAHEWTDSAMFHFADGDTVQATYKQLELEHALGEQSNTDPSDKGPAQ